MVLSLSRSRPRGVQPIGAPHTNWTERRPDRSNFMRGERGPSGHGVRWADRLAAHLEVVIDLALGILDAVTQILDEHH